MQEIKTIKSKAIYFLARREHSYAELLQKLSRYSENLDDIKHVLDNLKEQGLLSEERYIQNYLSSKSGKYGMLKLKYNLASKVDDADLIEQLIEESGIDQYEVALNLWQKKFGVKAQTQQE